MVINLNADEQIALQRLARREKRNSRDQAEWIIRQELQRRGFLPAEVKAAQAEGEPMEPSNEAQAA
jgi:dephospho-CoA kinase